MKFQATIVFEFNAGSVVDAGQKVDDVVRQAREGAEMDAKSIDVLTPPSSPPVTIPRPGGPT